MSELADKTCSTCNRDTPKLTREQIAALHPQAPEWEVRGERIHREFHFPSFVAAIRFVDEMARIAESEGHHPVFTVAVDKVDVENWTHAIGGLSENDFILAAKIDRAARDGH
jgi:4a-hydroxytetrahydrobiopterin dehydratase